MTNRINKNLFSWVQKKIKGRVYLSVIMQLTGNTVLSFLNCDRWKCIIWIKKQLNWRWRQKCIWPVIWSTQAPDIWSISGHWHTGNQPYLLKTLLTLQNALDMCVIIKLFKPLNIIYTKLHSQYRKNWRESIIKCPVRFVKKTVSSINGFPVNVEINFRECTRYIHILGLSRIENVNRIRIFENIKNSSLNKSPSPDFLLNCVVSWFKL